MQNIIHKILPVIIMLAIASPTILSRDKSGTISRQDKLKAEYYFIEAQKVKSHEDLNAYFDLVKRAHELDPGNSTYSFYTGFGILTMRNCTKTKAQQAVDMMKEHFDEYPGDYYETTFYSDANMLLGNPGEALRAIKALCDREPYRIELQMRLAEAYTRTGNYAMANATYDSIVSIHGKHLDISTKKITNYLTLKDSVSAINEMRSLLATAPKNVDYNITMGSLMQQLGMSDSAICYLNIAQEAEPDNGYTYLAKAQYYMMNGDSAEYEKQIFQALKNERINIEDKVEVLNTTIRQMIANQDTINPDTTDRIDTLFKVLTAIHPHEAIVRDMYGEYLSYRGDYGAAAVQQGYLLDLSPTDAEGWRKLMYYDVMNENYEGALKAADKALEYNPDSVTLYRYIAPIHYQMKNYDMAIKTYQLACQLADSTDVETLSDLYGGIADVYHQTGDTAASITYYEKALAMNPNNIGVLNNYAYNLAVSGKDLDKAERMAAKAVNAVPNSAIYLDTYAWVYFMKKDYKMALVYIKSAVENDSDLSAEELDHYGDILFMNGEHEKAVEQWKSALDKDPNNQNIKKKVTNKTIFLK